MHIQICKMLFYIQMFVSYKYIFLIVWMYANMLGIV